MGSVYYCVPGMGASGGMRVILEHCTRLADREHDVTIINPSGDSPMLWEWYGEINVPVVRISPAEPADVVVATGGSTVYWASKVPGRRHFYFVQMMEHLFFEPSTPGYVSHRQSYQAAKTCGMEVVTIAPWLQEYLREHWGIPSKLVANGVNREHFYPESDSDGEARYILIEGDDRNMAKDVEHISWKVADKIRDEFGFEVWGYAAYRHSKADDMDRFVIRPTAAEMRVLYSGAEFMLKASRYEGRSCSPVEAMCCGTPTVRGIINGDPDLVHDVNSLRVEYEYDAVLAAARLMAADLGLRDRRRFGGLKYAAENLEWEPIIDRLERIYGLR